MLFRSENENEYFNEHELRLFHMVEKRIGRLKDEAQMLREYGLQVRELFQAEAGRKILCKRFSTKSRMALESRADSGLNPLITESHGGQNGMRAGTA